MSVLEKFLILFETDAKASKKDVDKLGKSLDKTEKDATDAAKATAKTRESFINMGKSALGATAAIVAVGAAVAGIVAQAGRIDELGKFADLIGENIEDVDAWGEAVTRSGGSVSGFMGSIESLSEKLTDAAVRGSNEITPFFNQLGVSIVDTNGKVKSTLKILPELAKAFEGISKEKALGLGKKLGLDKGTIMLLQKGRDGVEELIERQRSLGVTSKEAAKYSEQFVDTLADLKQISNFAAQSFIVSFLPAINMALEAFNKMSVWVRNNKVPVYGFFAGLAIGAIPILYALATAGWAAISPFLVMAAPFIAIAAAAAAYGVVLALVIDDIMAFIAGNESLLGDMIEKWPIVGVIVSGVGDVIKDTYDAMKAIADLLTDMFKDPGKYLDSITNKIGKMGSWLGLGQDNLALAGGTTIGSQTSGSISNSSSRSTKVSTGDIIINTQATDADGIAGEAANSLSQQLRSTVDNFDDGVAR